MTPILIKLPIVPPKATKKNGKAIMRTRDGRMFIGKPHNSTWKQAVKQLTPLLLPHKPARPLQGALEVTTVWCWPHVSGTRKRDRGMMLPRSRRPDIENLNQGIYDLLTYLGFWYDDSQVAQEISEKWNGPEPFLRIEIRPAKAICVQEAG